MKNNEPGVIITVYFLLITGVLGSWRGEIMTLCMPSLPSDGIGESAPSNSPTQPPGQRPRESNHRPGAKKVKTDLNYRN